ncbi:MAG: HEAT repeat domain-containing protein [Planctomycetes bacterium]|nr:HEAT repeat domain-containing protein [Planctomycetota bacterium]
MKTQRYSVIVNVAYLITAATLAFVTTQRSLLAAGGKRLKPEQEYIAVLKSDAPLFEKASACRQLAIVGTRNAVAVLAGLLEDEILSDYARLALEPIDDPGVDAALRGAIDKVEGRLLAGVINSIGVRRDGEAVGRLSKFARDPSSPVAAEAIAALGRIATDQALDTILHVLCGGRPKLRVVAADACLAGAERLLAQDRRKEAVKLYDTVRNADIPGHLRAAATYGAILARGTDGISLLIEQLKTDNPLMVEIALRAARELSGPEVTQTLVTELNKSRPILQVLLIKALVDRKDPSAYEGIRTLAASDSPEVRIQTLKVLGEIGDVSTVPVLVKAVGAPGEEATIAGAALRRLKGDGVDEAIIAAMKAVKGQIRSELISVLADRRCTAVVPALLAEAASEDEAVATAAFKALTSLAGPKDLPALVELLAGLNSDHAHIHAENAVVAAAGRTEDRDKRTDDILARLNSADGIAVRSSLLRVLGRIANDRALQTLQNALNEKNDQIRDTAVRALAAWPNSRALNTLSAISQNTSDNTHRVLAFRGYVRLLGLDTELSQKEKVGMYKLAMSTARRNDEKKLVLAGLAKVAHPDALKIILDYIDRPEVRDEAILAAIKVAQATAGAQPKEAGRAALRIEKIATSQRIREQARSLTKTIDGFDDFIVAWQVAGPYFEGNRNHSELFVIAFPPETASSDVNWSLMPAGTDPKRPWILDLLKLYPGNSRAAYVRTWIKSEKRRHVVLEMGSDDGIKAWLGGKTVHANNIARAAVPGSDKANVTLETGWNRLMLKITQNVLPWEFCARIRNADGGKAEGIEIDCFHEESSAVVEQGS